MSETTPAKADEAPLPSLQSTVTGEAKNLGGSQFDAFNNHVLAATAQCAWVTGGESQDDALVTIGVGLAAFKPADEIEGMIAAQAVALHHGTMECLRRAMLPNQSGETASKLRKDGTNMARAFTDMLAALDRKRGKGQQHIRVERVVVQDGGQAIVGNVRNGG